MNLCERLKEGYRANIERDLEIAAEWFPLDEEAWSTFEKTAEKPTKKLTPRTRRS